MADELSAEELRSCLKKLVIKCGHMLQKSDSIDQAIEDIKHLEGTDENFHKYDMVRRLQQCIDEEFGDLINEEVRKENKKANEDPFLQEALVTRITTMIRESSRFKEINELLRKNISIASDDLMKNFEEEFSLDDQRSQYSRDFILHEDGDSSVDDSSLNQSCRYPMFPSALDLQSIADSLDKKNTTEKRRESLHKLLQLPHLDVQCPKVWESIREGLHDALADSDEQLWNLSLKFCARGFSAPDRSRDLQNVYMTLVQFLALQFNMSVKKFIPKVKNGLDCRKPEIIKFLKAFRLMNEFQHQVPQYWVRNRNQFMIDILDSTLNLLAIHPTTASGGLSHLTPIHFLALIDIKAAWFIKWTHGHYSRGELLSMLEKYRPIIENAVKAIFDYVAAIENDVELIKDEQDTKSKNSKRPTYTGLEMEYIYFVHSLHFVCTLISYENGRKFFPVKVKDREETITLSNLLVTLVQLMTDTLPHTKSDSYEPSLLTTEVFKTLCASDTVCKKCMCKDDVTNALLAPVSVLLDGSDLSTKKASELTLIHLAEILSVIASHSCGRHHLLYGETRAPFTRSKSSPIHIIAEFSRRALKETLPGSKPPSNAVIGSFVYICRQLYSSCEGLYVTNPYGLQTSIAEAWRRACKEADRGATPTPSCDNGENGESQNVVLWEDTLQDNLLNFASTPKGLLLLQQTGAIYECVAYMYTRYAQKLQVSKNEKFGYGYMVSLVTATAPGMLALMNTDFMKALVKSLWGILEVIDDNPPFTPKTWPVMVIDKSAIKAFNNTVTVLSSFSAVYELLHGQKLPAKQEYSLRDIPGSLPDLLSRIVVVDTDAKILSLLNYEQTHVFGLRLLSVLTSCLDTFLLLQTQYKFQEVLLKCQKENVPEDRNDIIIDMLSVERNYILVKTFLIGGSSERKLPARTLDMESSKPYPYPLFSTYPVPESYISYVGAKSAMKQENDLSRYLQDTKGTPPTLQWLEKCRKSFCSVLTAKPEQCRGTVIQDLLERSLQAIVDIPEEAIFPLLEYTGSDSLLKSYKLSKIQEHGIKLAIRYGMHLKLVPNEQEAKERLTYLMKKVGYFLKQQQRSATTNKMACLQDCYPGNDWFVCTIFLLMHGNVEKSWKVLHSFTATAASAYLWMHRLHSSVHLPPPLMLSGIPSVFSATCHNLELILQAEVSHVYSAFKMAGYTPAQICQHWIRQCFWNYLEWLEICHYLCTCLILGMDYQVYMCVAILRHQQRDILQHQQTQDLIVFLKEEPIRGFKVGHHLEYMQQLEKKYRKVILSDLQNISKP